jgi:hypothetical protein
MAIYGLMAVHLDASGRVTQARMQQVNGATNSWIGQPGQFEAHEVANLIAIGDDVYSIFIVPGGTVLGPKFRVAVYQHSEEGIELENNVEGRRVQDLLLF